MHAESSIQHPLDLTCLLLTKLVYYLAGKGCESFETAIPKVSKPNFKNSLIIHEENTKKNHKRVVSLYVDKDFPSFT